MQQNVMTMRLSLQAMCLRSRPSAKRTKQNKTKNQKKQTKPKTTGVTGSCEPLNKS